jgi:heat-inducible transcriptional repressor
MTTTSLDDRRKEVLRSLVELHVETGEPVGSESLARALNRSVSPATLRNIMADLEALGYLDHPHTSAGRMPTDEGYRFYVDSLMGRPRPLAPEDAAAIQSGLRKPEASPNQVLENASRLLSRLSQHVGFVVLPEIDQTSFKHIDLVLLAPPRILVVMVSRSGMVTNKVVEIQETPTQEQLQACANYLNAEFAGMPLASVRSRLLELMREDKSIYDSLLKNVIALGNRAFAQGDEASVYLGGTANILAQPEFEDLERMRALFRTFEEKSRLVKILNACISGDGLRILIGHENPAPDLQDLSLVAARYPVEGEANWALGVLGSTRMEYAHVVSLVDHVARSVSQVLRELRS